MGPDRDVPKKKKKKKNPPKEGPSHWSGTSTAHMHNGECEVLLADCSANVTARYM